MKNKYIVIVAVVVALILGIGLIKNSGIFKARAKKTTVLSSKVQAQTAKAPAQAAKEPAKKTFSKDMGGLTVNVKDVNKKDLNLRISAYKAADRDRSVYAAAFTANRMQELSPGAYDIQLETIPPMLCKGIEVSRDKETVKDLGAMMSAVNIKLLKGEKKDASVSVRIMKQGSRTAITSGATNRPIQLLPGTYDVEINTVPRQLKKDVKAEAGKEALIDLGDPMGALVVKAVDENNKETRLGARIKKADTGEEVAGITTNRPIDILKGVYTIELLSSPAQTKKDVTIEAGSESTVEFTVEAPRSAPARVPPPAKAPVKK